MTDVNILEAALEQAILPTHPTPVPPRLQNALRYAVFPGGARLRPQLCLAVAHEGPTPNHAIALATAVAVELLHCASLVHDDLPCFDDAPLRRGRPSVHSQFGEPLAVLVGDGLMMLALGAVHRVWRLAPKRVARIAYEMSLAANRLVMGQAWEDEPCIDIAVYQRDKTAALFEAAAVGGAIASGAPTARWRRVGQALGEAYQVADDILDVAVELRAGTGKLGGRDALLGRPNQVLQTGMVQAQRRLVMLLGRARRRGLQQAGPRMTAWFEELEARMRLLVRVPSADRRQLHADPLS